MLSVFLSVFLIYHQTVRNKMLFFSFYCVCKLVSTECMKVTWGFRKNRTNPDVKVGLFQQIQNFYWRNIPCHTLYLQLCTWSHSLLLFVSWPFFRWQHLYSFCETWLCTVLLKLLKNISDSLYQNTCLVLFFLSVSLNFFAATHPSESLESRALAAL